MGCATCDKAPGVCGLAAYCAGYVRGSCTPATRCGHSQQMTALRTWAAREGLAAAKIAALERQNKRAVETTVLLPGTMFSFLAIAARKNCEAVRDLLLEEETREDYALAKMTKANVHEYLARRAEVPSLPKARLEELRDNLDDLLLLLAAEERERKAQPGEDGVRRCAWDAKPLLARAGSSKFCANGKCEAKYYQRRKRIRDGIKTGFSGFSGGRQTLGEMAEVLEREGFRHSIAVTLHEAAQAAGKAKRRKKA